MNEASPTKGDWSDEPTGRLNCGKVGPSDGHLEGGYVRTGFSNSHAIQFSALEPTGSSRSQSERDLDLPEAAGRRAEGRASGKSDGTRSDRRETSCGWRGVSVALHAEEGQHHE